MYGQPPLRTAKDLMDFEFGQIAPPPPEFDLNRAIEGRRQFTLGDHLVEVADFAVPDGYHEFRVKGETHMLNQLRPLLRAVAPEMEGAAITDFLAMPTEHRPMPLVLANRWVNFIHALGFEFESSILIPSVYQGRRWRLGDILGKRCYITVVQQVNAEGEKKFLQDGLPALQVKSFSYRRCGTDAAAAAAPQGSSSSSPSPAPGKPAAAAGGEFDL